MDSARITRIAFDHQVSMRPRQPSAANLGAVFAVLAEMFEFSKPPSNGAAAAEALECTLVPPIEISIESSGIFLG